MCIIDDVISTSNLVHFWCSVRAAFFCRPCKTKVIIGLAEQFLSFLGPSIFNFLICCANIAIEHYGKRIKIVYGCHFEDCLNRNGHQKCMILILFPKCSIVLLAPHVKKLETYFALLIFLDFRIMC